MGLERSGLPGVKFLGQWQQLSNGKDNRKEQGDGGPFKMNWRDSSALLAKDKCWV